MASFTHYNILQAAINSWLVMGKSLFKKEKNQMSARIVILDPVSSLFLSPLRKACLIQPFLCWVWMLVFVPKPFSAKSRIGFKRNMTPIVPELITVEKLPGGGVVLPDHLQFLVNSTEFFPNLQNLPFPTRVSWYFTTSFWTSYILGFYCSLILTNCSR